MQILQWLFKDANETNSNTTSSKKEILNAEEVKSQDVVLFGISQKKRNRSRSSCKIFNLFNASRRKDIAADYFYSTIHLKRLGSSRRRQRFVHCMKMKKQSLTRGLSFRRKADSVNAKVLPVTDAVGTTPAPKNGDKEQSFSAEKKEKDKTKTTSKMKELIRWAAAAKSQKGRKYFGQKVLHLRDRSILTAEPRNDDDDDDKQLCYDSPKISFRWDVESCSTTFSTKDDLSINNSPLNSTIDQCPAAARKGNWVTTDSECKYPFLFDLHKRSLN
ncbi:hypothetical protein HAX54_016156 [Datura stramonium]|uniref:Uncharacterized protein n=1 Tax=Datura stramonium TaxID=4076 RepID=A0ABS8S0H5_DATST|nr:hypothetical protein [Datura stramonium]